MLRALMTKKKNHPSTGTQATVTTASGNRYTVLFSTAIVEELELI